MRQRETERENLERLLIYRSAKMVRVCQWCSERKAVAEKPSKIIHRNYFQLKNKIPPKNHFSKGDPVTFY